MTLSAVFERAKFIGFDAFKEIFKMKDFYIALRNTIVLNGLDRYNRFSGSDNFGDIIK